MIANAPSSVSPPTSISDPDSPPAVNAHRESEDTNRPSSHHCRCAHDAYVDLEEGCLCRVSPSESEAGRQHAGSFYESGEAAIDQHALEESSSLQGQGLLQGANGDERPFEVGIDNTKSSQSVVETSCSDADVENGLGASHIKQGDREEGPEQCCRICHLTFDKGLKASDLYELGCACKDDLAVAHQRCAETWFRLKGNRTCEICGSLAENVFANKDQHSAPLCDDEATCPRPIHEDSCWQSQPCFSKIVMCVLLIMFTSWLLRVTLL